MRTNWGKVSASGYPVPEDESLTDLTAELTELLGAPDAAAREDVAVTTLVTWLRRGVYDDLLQGLGDGMVHGLGAATAARRGASATVLAGCLGRAHGRVTDHQVLAWGDRIVTWLLAEPDDAALRRGCETVGALAAHPAFGAGELAVLLDVLAERAHGLTHEPTADRLAITTLQVLRRNLVPVDVVESWLGGTGTTEATYLRALHLHLSLAADPPTDRADLLLLLIDRLRAIHPALRPR